MDEVTDTDSEDKESTNVPADSEGARPASGPAADDDLGELGEAEAETSDEEAAESSADSNAEVGGIEFWCPRRVGGGWKETRHAAAL